MQAGAPIEERGLSVARKQPLAFRVIRGGKPDFIYPPQEQSDFWAVTASNRRQAMT